MGCWGGGGGEGVGGLGEEEEVGSNTRAGFVSAKPESEWRETRLKEKQERNLSKYALFLLPVFIQPDVSFVLKLHLCRLLPLLPWACSEGSTGLKSNSNNAIRLRAVISKSCFKIHYCDLDSGPLMNSDDGDKW